MCDHLSGGLVLELGKIIASTKGKLCNCQHHLDGEERAGCFAGVSWWLSGSSSRCHRVVCGL